MFCSKEPRGFDNCFALCRDWSPNFQKYSSEGNAIDILCHLSDTLEYICRRELYDSDTHKGETLINILVALTTYYRGSSETLRQIPAKRCTGKEVIDCLGALLADNIVYNEADLYRLNPQLVPYLQRWEKAIRIEPRPAFSIPVLFVFFARYFDTHQPYEWINRFAFEGSADYTPDPEDVDESDVYTDPDTCGAEFNPNSTKCCNCTTFEYCADVTSSQTKGNKASARENLLPFRKIFAEAEHQIQNTRAPGDVTKHTD